MALYTEQIRKVKAENLVHHKCAAKKQECTIPAREKTHKRFQVCGNLNVPLEETKFGVILCFSPLILFVRSGIMEGQTLAGCLPLGCCGLKSVARFVRPGRHSFYFAVMYLMQSR